MTIARISSRAEPWWMADRDAVPDVIWDHLCTLAQWRVRRLRQVAELLRQLERELWGPLGGGRGSNSTVGDQLPAAARAASGEGRDWESDPPSGGSYNQLRLNLEGIATRILKDAPAIEVKLRNAKYEHQLAAREINGLLDATLNTDQAENDLLLWGIVGLLTGFAFEMPEIVDRRVEFRHVPEQDVWWDPADARRGNPRSLHVTTQISRSEMIGCIEQRDDLGPREKNRMIDEVAKLRASNPWGAFAGTAGVLTPYDQDLHSWAGSSALASDLIHRTQSWHLPGWQGAGDGRVVETVHGGDRHGGTGDWASVLVRYDKWMYSTFPGVWWSPHPPYQGMIGVGYGHLLEPFQTQSDRMWEVFDRDMAQFGRPKLLYWGELAGEVLAALDDAGVNAVQMPGSAPNMAKPYELVLSSPHNPQMLDWYDRVERAMSRAIGADSPAIGGRSQLGANASGISQLVELDRSDERLSLPTQRFGTARLRLAIEILNACDRAADEDSAFALQIHGRDGSAREFRWGDLDLPRTSYDLGLERVGALSRDKTGRLQQIIELAGGGAIPQDDAMAEVASHADIARVVSTSQAPRLLVEWQLAGLAKPGKKDDEYSEFFPVEDQDLVLAVRLGAAAIMTARRQGADEDTLLRLQEYGAIARDLQKQVEAGAPGEEPGPGAPPIGDMGAIPPEMADAAIPPLPEEAMVVPPEGGLF